MSPLRNAMPTPLRISPLQFLLLIQLDSSPKYGYEMLKNIKEAFKGVWEPKTGTLYPALKSLEKRGLVELLVKNEVDFYKITENGRRFLEQIGPNQESSSRFSSRFLLVLIKWISPELKNKIISSFSRITNEDANMFGKIISFFNEGVEKDSQLLFLKEMRNNMSKKINELDKIIAEMEVQGG
jgi:DNA-binding PadR family transcriptional regulator